MQTIILLRRETALKICETSHNRKTSAEKRSHVVSAFESCDKKRVSKELETFFTESVRDFTFKV